MIREMLREDAWPGEGSLFCFLAQDLAHCPTRQHGDVETELSPPFTSLKDGSPPESRRGIKATARSHNRLGWTITSCGDLAESSSTLGRIWRVVQQLHSFKAKQPRWAESPFTADNLSRDSETLQDQVNAADSCQVREEIRQSERTLGKSSRRRREDSPRLSVIEKHQGGGGGRDDEQRRIVVDQYHRSMSGGLASRLVQASCKSSSEEKAICIGREYHRGRVADELARFEQVWGQK
ncbi:hypothetical protein V8F33_009755 [Rhypophila sp. PSN 637]